MGRAVLVAAALLASTASALLAASSAVQGPRRVGVETRSSVIDVEAATVDDEVDDVVAEKKKALLDAIAGTERGFNRDKDQAEAVRAAIQSLADARTEPPDPLKTQNWTLAWTDAPDILGLAGGPLSRLGRIGQEVDATEGTVVNVIEWSPSPLATLLRKDFADDVVQQRVITGFTEPTPGDVKLVLKGAGLRPKRVLGRNVDEKTFDAVGPLSLPFGEFTVLYNDGDLRCVRTGQNFYSVNVRMI